MTGVGGSLRGWLRSWFWIPAFRGNDGVGGGMTGVGGSLRGWLRSCVLDSRVRGNDGVGGGNDGCGWVVTGVGALLCFGFPRSRE